MADEAHLEELRLLAADAAAAGQSRLRAAVLAELQRRSAWALRDIVSALRAEGVSWRDLAADLGVSVATLHRQYEAGHRLIVRADDGVAPAGDGHATEPAHAAAPPGRPRPAPGLNLFVGRERELADLRPLLGRNRLVTLVGPAGVGKTRLATEYLQRAGGTFPAGVWWVDLAPLTPQSAVASAISAAAANGGPGGRTAVEVITEACAAKAGLLVLDNCEHLVPQCASVVAELLMACPRLRMLATSREPLGVAGEALLPVAPFDVPPSASRSADWLALPAVRLFVNRATAVAPDFALVDEEAALVARICRELDGLPLAIELAASRVRLFGIGEILTLLRDRFALLDVPAGADRGRHRSLHAAIEWSHDVLLPVEQAVFRRLSIMAGGFDLAGATAVCADGVEVTADAILPVLSSLHTKSLITRADSDTGPRFRQLDSVRLYASEQLDAAGERDAAHDRMADWFYEFVVKYFHEGHTELGDPWLHMSAEMENLERATRWAEQRGDDRYAGLAFVLAEVWRCRRSRADAQQLLVHVEQTGVGTPFDRAIGLCLLASILVDVERFEDSAAVAERAVALGRSPEASAALPEAVEVLGQAYAYGERWTEALACYDESVELARRIRGPWWAALGVMERANCLVKMGELDEAAAALADVDAVIRAGKDVEALTRYLAIVGRLQVERGDIDAAERAWREQVETVSAHLEILAAHHLPRGLEWLAVVADRRGEPDRVLRLAAAAESAREKYDWRLPPVHQVAHAIAHARQAAADVESACAEGAGWTEQEAIDYALGRVSAGAARAAESPLTAREQQVADLVAGGFTNQQIASRLGVANSTVISHVASIRAKLDLPSRAHIVAWVIRQEA